MRKIKLTQGKYAIVDDEDYPYLSRFKWAYNKENGTVVLSGRAVPLGYLIIGAKKGYKITYKNNNTLDFRKENLIYATHVLVSHRGKAQNTYSKKPVASKYKGVQKSTSTRKGKMRRSKTNPWKAGVIKDGIYCHIGVFKSEKEAARAYNEKAKELYGDLAYQNKI